MKNYGVFSGVLHGSDPEFRGRFCIYHRCEYGLMMSRRQSCGKENVSAPLFLALYLRDKTLGSDRLSHGSSVRRRKNMVQRLFV